MSGMFPCISTEQPGDIQKKKTLIRRIFLILNVALLLVWIVLFMKNSNGIQRQVFFHDRNDWFMDFFNTVYYSTGNSPYSWGNAKDRNYLPLVYLLLNPLTRLFNYDISDWDTAYFSRYDQVMADLNAYYIVISFIVFLFPLYKALKKRFCNSSIEEAGIFTVVLFSYITLFSIDRGNLWTLTVGLCSMYLNNYQSDNIYRRFFGVTCLVIASVFKIFPVFLGFLLLYNRQYKEIIIGIVEGLILSIVPFAFLNGGFINNITAFIQALRMHAAAYSDGFFGFGAPTIISGISFSFPYLNLVYLIFAITCAWFIKDEWYRITLLTLSAVLTSGQQGIYALLMLFYPMFVFLCDNYRKTDILSLILFTLIIQPCQYSFSFGIIQLTNLTVMNTCMMLAYTVMIIFGIIKFSRRCPSCRLTACSKKALKDETQSVQHKNPI